MLNYETNTPSTMDEPKRIFEEIRGYKARFKERFELDHCMDGELDTSIAGADGQHNQVTLYPRISDPVLISGTNIFYSKLVNSIPELFCRKSDGVYQMTENGGIKFDISSNQGIPSGFKFVQIEKNNVCFLAVIQESSTANSRWYLYRSDDGLIWENAIGTGYYNYAIGIIECNNVLFVFYKFYYNYFKYTTDGNTFNDLVFGERCGLTGVLYDGSKYIIVTWDNISVSGDTLRIYTGTNLSSLIKRYEKTDSTLTNNAGYGYRKGIPFSFNGVYKIVGRWGLTSSDGINWTEGQAVSFPLDYAEYFIVLNNTCFIFCDYSFLYGMVYYSSDLTTWNSLFEQNKAYSIDKEGFIICEGTADYKNYYYYFGLNKIIRRQLPASSRFPVLKDGYTIYEITGQYDNTLYKIQQFKKVS